MQDVYFPFDKIERGARVILYGAGYNAKKLLKINEETGWCHIAACVDCNYQGIYEFPQPVYAPQEIFEKAEYDYVLVTLIDEYQRKKIAWSLLEMGVPKEKIVDAFLKPEKRILYLNRTEASEKLKIGFHPMGVIGDCIISLKVYQELVRLSEERCEMYVLNEYDAWFMEKVFYGQKCLCGIVNGHSEIKREDLEKYDLTIDVRFEPSIVSCDMERIRELTPQLAESIAKLIEYQDSDYVDIPAFQYANRILLDRARFLGLNRYTLFGISGAFDVRDMKVDFFINAEFEEEFCGLSLDTPYITYNYGANDQYKDGRCQTKMWPYEYHAELNKLIKTKWPEIELIQIGGADVTKIPGADRCLLGQDLEVSKYILKNALLHIDCEGGLVHLASQLGTTCLVVFGPTPSWFLGYAHNINIDPLVCGECKGLVKDWYTRCYLHDKPECMYSITPEYVLQRIEEYLGNYLCRLQ